MEQRYTFLGSIHPARAEYTTREFSVGITALETGVPAVLHLSIIRNQIAATVESVERWDIFDLRNVVKNLLETHVAIVGFLTGHAYSVELTRVLNRADAIDYVFGVDIPCIVERMRGVDVDAQAKVILGKAVGPHGVYLTRCLADLSMAMREAGDTPFYCYRAIESLRHHCAAVRGIVDEPRAAQWAAFHAVTGGREALVRDLEPKAVASRHGEPVLSSSADRAAAMTKAWEVVAAYIDQLPSPDTEHVAAARQSRIRGGGRIAR